MELEESEQLSKEVSRRYLYEIIRECQGKTIEEKLLSMEEKLKESTRCPVDQNTDLRRSLRYFKTEFKRKWVDASYKEDRFLKNNNEWLNGTINMPTWVLHKTGRPCKDFGECSERSKRRKTKGLREEVPHDQLTFAACMSERAAGNLEVSDIIKEITSTPTRAAKVKKLLAAKETCKTQKLTPPQALSIFVEADLSKNQYEVIRSANKEIYPCYSLLKEAKKECYPSEDNTIVTETLAEIRLQALLDHTSSRLCTYLEDVLDKLDDEEKHSLELFSKWGCDGSNQSQFKQKFQNSADNDSSIFQSSLVPLRLSCQSRGKKRAIWQNPVPSSTRFCRPIRIRFVHETADVTTEEMGYIQIQVNELQKSVINTPRGVNLHVKHTLLPTMVDAKVCNAVTSTESTIRCYICGKTSKDFNKLKDDFVENPEALRFGLSPLHARIRFFESILHLSYKLPLQKWQAKTQEEKNVVKERKKDIQIKFKEELGLLVDVPKQGMGNSNDGNTSRRFFSDPTTASQITGVDETLIKRCKIILETLSSGFKVDVQKFYEFTQETAKLYVNLYGWYPMTPTMHKILVHGASVISNAILPIGQLSEEASEARTKHFRKYRQDFSRKFSRALCLKDVLNRLLLTSDPLLSCSRSKQPGKRIPFSPETLALLLPESPLEIAFSSDEEEMCLSDITDETNID